MNHNVTITSRYYIQQLCNLMRPWQFIAWSAIGGSVEDIWLWYSSGNNSNSCRQARLIWQPDEIIPSHCRQLTPPIHFVLWHPLPSPFWQVVDNWLPSPMRTKAHKISMTLALYQYWVWRIYFSQYLIWHFSNLNPLQTVPHKLPNANAPNQVLLHNLPCQKQLPLTNHQGRAPDITWWHLNIQVDPISLLEIISYKPVPLRCIHRSCQAIEESIVPDRMNLKPELQELLPGLAVVDPLPRFWVIDLSDAVSGCGFSGARDKDFVGTGRSISDHANNVDVTDLWHLREDLVGTSDRITDN